MFPTFPFTVTPKFPTSTNPRFSGASTCPVIDPNCHESVGTPPLASCSNVVWFLSARNFSRISSTVVDESCPADISRYWSGPPTPSKASEPLIPNKLSFVPDVPLGISP